MNRFIMAMTTAVALTSSVSLFAQDRSAALQSSMVRSTTLVVENMDQSIDFYQRLGLVKASDQMSRDSDPGGVVGASDLPLTADPRLGRLVMMRGHDDRAGMIGLLGYDQPPLASARSNLVGIGTSDVILMIIVQDIQGTYSRLQQAGVRFHRTPYTYSMANPDGSSSTGMRMFAYDPDGRLVEIAQPD